MAGLWDHFLRLGHTQRPDTVCSLPQSTQPGVPQGNNVYIRSGATVCTFGTTVLTDYVGTLGTCAAPPPSPPVIGPPDASLGNDPRAIGGDGSTFRFRGAVHHGKTSSRTKKIKNSDDGPQKGGPSVA